MMFATKKQNCVGCKAVLNDNKSQKISAPLCNRCEGREAELYLQKLNNVRDQQANFNQLWTECQRCRAAFTKRLFVVTRTVLSFTKGRRRKSICKLLRTPWTSSHGEVHWRGQGKRLS